MLVWKMIFLFQGCILRFIVNLAGCTQNDTIFEAGDAFLQRKPYVWVSIHPNWGLSFIGFATKKKRLETSTSS